MKSAGGTVIVLISLLLAGCAASGGPVPAGTRCRDDAAPGAPAGGPRPLFFLVCVQAP